MSTDDCITPIGFPPRTRVYHLERDALIGAWLVWLAMPHGGASVPSLQRLGTFLCLWDDGKVERMTRDDEGTRVMLIKEKDT